MASDLSATHDAQLQSWVASANGHPEFPIQNLPLGVFSPPGGKPRGGVAIGDEILDLGAALEAGLFTGEAAKAAEAACQPTLNALLALGRGPRAGAAGASLRRCWRPPARSGAGLRGSETGCCTGPRTARCMCRRRWATTRISMPASSTRPNVGRLFRPDNPLMPNYKYVPIGYHGRASSIRPSGTPVRRPNGQRKPASETVPTFGPCRNLDYELEIGIWIGPGNALGEPIPIAEAAEHIGGFCLFNDWSARDIQAWEYQPLGPFLAKNFGSTVSPWIVTPEALEPFRIPQPPRPEGDPAPLDYLLDAADQQRRRVRDRARGAAA